MNGTQPKKGLPLPRWGGIWSAASGRAGGTASWTADLAVGAGLFGLLYIVVVVATGGSARTPQTTISLRFSALPLYAMYSLTRMTAAYLLSLVFAVAYGYVAACSRRAERILAPVLDILQSIPILSFLPPVVLALTGLFPRSGLGAELASVLLVFTSQAWNMAFSFYHSMLTVPRELREVARMYNLSPWQRFRQLELPFATVGLVWNSMMSWAGGWFFLMAAEMFTLGDRSFQLPGLGSYLQQAANHGDLRGIVGGIATLVLLIAGLDQLLWRPLIAWADRFKVETVGNGTPPRSAVLIMLRRSHLVEWMMGFLFSPLVERADHLLSHVAATGSIPAPRVGRRVAGYLIGGAVVALIAFALWRALGVLASTPRTEIERLPAAALFTTLRVAASLLLSCLWTIPLGVFIGMNRAWANRLQPVVQILASVPATALFPIVLLWLGSRLAWGSVLLMLLGVQWYVLFNVIAGAMSIPEDLKEVTALFRLGRLERWRTLIIPGIFPFLITGLITASGGAWNAAVVAEYVQFAGHTVFTVGLGAEIARASQDQEYGLLLSATLTLSLLVVLVNRLFWRRMYRLAETRYGVSA